MANVQVVPQELCPVQTLHFTEQNAIPALQQGLDLGCRPTGCHHQETSLASLLIGQKGLCS